MSPEQCAAARAWLGWSQQQLAAKADVSANTVRQFEARQRTPHPNNLKAMRRALEEAGIHFTDHPQGISKSAAPKRRR